MKDWKKVSPYEANWSKISACTQKEGEDIEEFLKRLAVLFKTNSGITDMENNQSPFVAVLVQNCNRQLQGEFKMLCIGWEGKIVNEALPVAKTLSKTD